MAQLLVVLSVRNFSFSNAQPMASILGFLRRA